MPTPVSRILVALDFSPQADAALSYATTVARGCGASVDLLHVVDDRLATADWVSNPSLRALTAVREQAIDESSRRLARLVTGLQLDGLVARWHVVVGQPAPALVAAAATHGSDLIAMGTRGLSGLPHLIVGSVADRVVRTASCPVLTVRVDATVKADVPAMVAHPEPAF
jgi:nucleotide-binding universal stress UspA family protein